MAKRLKFVGDRNPFILLASGIVTVALAYGALGWLSRAPGIPTVEVRRCDFTGRVARISTLATVDFTGGWPFPKNFELAVGLDEIDPRLRPSMNATVRIAVEHVRDATLIPAEAVFHKAG